MTSDSGTCPNYHEMDLETLYDIYAHLDKEAHPERAEALMAAIESKGGGLHEAESRVNGRAIAVLIGGLAILWHFFKQVIGS